ncbi:MAG: hypothetical protein JZU65_21415, partial [Chlorobium sp.]|nr:hypothetical protein [Chlorobium sp.]
QLIGQHSPEMQPERAGLSPVQSRRETDPVVAYTQTDYFSCRVLLHAHRHFATLAMGESVFECVASQFIEN